MYCSFNGAEIFKDHFESEFAQNGANNNNSLDISYVGKNVLDERGQRLDRLRGSLYVTQIITVYNYGIYVCSKCGYELFSSNTKYKHSSPWPAFTNTIHKDSVSKKEERPGALKICCGKCNHGLGHEFLNDGPKRGLSRF